MADCPTDTPHFPEFRGIYALGHNLLGTIARYIGIMKNENTISALVPEVPSVLTVLQRGGHLQLDPVPLTEIYAKMGQTAAENAVCRTLEDLALRLGGLLDLKTTCEFDKMVRPAKTMATCADQVGLVEVARAARHVSNCAANRDGVALEATLARLERAYDLAISEIWDFRAY